QMVEPPPIPIKRFAGSTFRIGDISIQSFGKQTRGVIGLFHRAIALGRWPSPAIDLEPLVVKSGYRSEQVVVGAYRNRGCSDRDPTLSCCVCQHPTALLFSPVPHRPFSARPRARGAAGEIGGFVGGGARGPAREFFTPPPAGGRGRAAPPPPRGGGGGAGGWT